MKFSVRSYPVLGFLELDKPGIKVTELDLAYAKYTNLSGRFDKKWGKLRTKMKENIFFISTPFETAASGNFEKLNTPELLSQLTDMSGVYILNKLSVCFDLKRVIINGDNASLIDVFAFRGDILVCMLSIDENGKFADCFLAESEKNLVADLYIGLPNSNLDIVKGYFYQIVFCFTLFKKFAEIETKVLLPNTKVKDYSCNYKNETASTVTILDSNWFTTLVKSDGFKVRGHFRLQPKKKDGVWTKELIWITDFEKSGYTTPARKLAR